MNKQFLIFLILLPFVLQCCEDTDNESGIKMEFYESQCSNPWDVLPGNENYLFEVQRYLSDAGIEIYSISVKNINEGEIHCEACNCSSGRKIIIRIPEEDKEEAENIGFY